MTKQKLTDKLRLEIIKGLVELYWNTDCSLKSTKKIFDYIYKIKIAHSKKRYRQKDRDLEMLIMYKKLKKAGIL